ncbi:hypothetical protein AAFF_G00087140 [Aldrovandia affinis]|uniref:non-specific serine/threonine protein kinase n=1 Tax=Aldrovandia affinis TaxID=143900 RepID=A0AAD7WCD9_9TELE|nr:hypothetical protein AAFF_G00087140 [Aldrovandia affinis]
MSSRRPMTRSFSGNGRSGSLNEEEAPPPSNRPDSRNYLMNVRPENRSTLCTVMAQLTEETQPSFETTVKSKAVSKDSNVKFSCEVSGYPVPELTWYKDDMEMDRYCGLPKYEIFRNGKVHTLHIYNCTEEDAAIYQASARNNKGIVSCSGVLEVGTMNEYKIHQRFFAKLKQKADAKRRELEENRRRGRGKENVQQAVTVAATVPGQLLPVSPEHPQRKRRSPGEPGPRPSSAAARDGEAEAKTRAPRGPRPRPGCARGLGMGVTEPLPPAAAEMPNGFPADARVASGSDPNQEAGQENGGQDLMYIYETVEIVTTTSRRPNKEPPATKRPKISNGVGGREGGGSPSEKGPEDKSDGCDEGGMSLAQYLAESMKSQAFDDNEENSTEDVLDVEVMEVDEVDVTASPAIERAAQTVQPPGEVRAEAQSNVSKKQEAPNGQGSLSAVFFSLRDMFFGSKNSSAKEADEDAPKHSRVTAAEKEPPPAPPQPRPSPKAHWWESDAKKDLKARVGETVRMEVEEQPPSGGADPVGAPRSASRREVRREVREMPRRRRKARVRTAAPGEIQFPRARRAPPRRSRGRRRGSRLVCCTSRAGPTSGRGEGPPHRPHVRLLHHRRRRFLRCAARVNRPAGFGIRAVAEDRVQTEKNRAPVGQDLVVAPREPDAQAGAVFTSAGGQVTTDAGETDTLHDRGQTAPAEPERRARPHSRGSGEISTETKADPQNSGLENTGCQESISGHNVSPTVNSDPLEAKPVKEEEDEHVKENAVESGDVNSQISQANASVFVEESVDLEGKGSPLSAAQETEAERTLETKEEGEKEVADRPTIQPVAVELNPPEVPQQDEAVADNPPESNNHPKDDVKEIELILPLAHGANNDVDLEEKCVSPTLGGKEEISIPPPVSQKVIDAKEPGSRADGGSCHSGGRHPVGEKRAEEGTGGDTPPAVPSCESSPRLRRRDSLTLIPSATPQELASGARRKIFLSKSKGEGGEGTEKEEASKRRTLSQEQEAPPPRPRRDALPSSARKKATLEVPKRHEEAVEETDTAKTDTKPQEKETLDPFKAPQVIRKIRGEPFSDALGHLKLWCQFFNVLSDSTIKWYRDEVEIAEVKRSAGDESQVALAIVQTSSRDCGVYACSIKNEYGMDTTDFLLSADILSDFLLRGDLEVGEEIEMTPMLFTKGLADPGYWGDKFFGRIMTEEVHIGEGCAHKACKVKVIYGLEPVFDSGSSCIIKVRNPIPYGTKDEKDLVERNLAITKQASAEFPTTAPHDGNECKIQNTAREYCKVFAAEARVIENFGPALEMLPRYLMYRPANTVPYATVEVDLQGMFLKYCLTDATGRMIMRSSSEVEQKCCTFQHWIHQWTNGNLLVTQLEGVGTRVTNVGIVTKSKGYQGLSDSGSPKVFEQFVSQHQCNYYCGLLGLRPLKPVDAQPQPAKIKGSRSPLLNRKAGPGTSSPQLQRKGLNSPQGSRKAASSPKVARKSPESGTTANPRPNPTPRRLPKQSGRGRERNPQSKSS